MLNRFARFILFLCLTMSTLTWQAVLPHDNSLPILPATLPGQTYVSNQCDYRDTRMGFTECFVDDPQFGIVGLMLYNDKIASASWGIPSSVTIGEIIAHYGQPLGYHVYTDSVVIYWTHYLSSLSLSDRFGPNTAIVYMTQTLEPGSSMILWHGFNITGDK